MKNCIYGAAIFIAACFSCTSPKAKECVVEGEVKGYGDGFFCVMTETLDEVHGKIRRLLVVNGILRLEFGRLVLL